ncbi:calphotin-like, partial [Astyanax mexicanus]
MNLVSEVIVPRLMGGEDCLCEEELEEFVIKMDEDKGVDFQSLKARFQNDETLKIRVKPAIPEKPKALTSPTFPTSPTTKISNPLVTSIMENRMSFTPRVVFKDDKKSPGKRPVSMPEPLPLNMNPELVDKKQKKEGDLIKQALKDKNLPLVLPVNPVIPVIEETPKPDPISASSAVASPSKVSTPKKKIFFNFSKSPKAEKEKRDIAESTVPVNPALDHLAPSSSTPVNSTPIVNKPVSYKALVPPSQAEVVPASSSPIIPVIPAPVISNPAIPEPEVPEVRTVPEMDIVSQVCSEPDILKPKSPIPVAVPDVSLPENMTTEMPDSTEMPDILDMDIPPPIIPEDIPDADIYSLDIPVPVTPDLFITALSTSSTPPSSSPNLSRTASPAPVRSASVTPEPANLVLPTLTPNPDAASSPRTSPILSSAATDVKPVTENGTAESHEGMDQTEKTPELLSSTSSTPISALSVLARAEEMAPVKHTICDQRVLNLLEKAKRKHNVSHQTPTPTTPESPGMVLPDTTSPALAPVESSTPKNLHPEATQAEPAPAVEAAQVRQSLVVDLPDIPPVDYEDQSGDRASVRSNTPSSETALTNGLDHNRASPAPKVLTVHKPAAAKGKPPPPPPRKTPVTVPNGSITPEKPARVLSTDLQTSTLADQPVEENGIIIPAPVDFTSENSSLDDSEFDDSSEPVALEDPQQAELPEHESFAFSVHEQAFLEQLYPEYQTNSEEFVPSVETTETDSAPKATGTPDSVPDSPVSPSPSGTLEMNDNGDNNIYEDLAANKRQKSTKKPRKIVPMNPYADSVNVITGEEEAMYEIKARETCKGRKNDLAV